jgi:hypothetical protein
MKKYISIIIVTLTLAASSCKKDYLNLQVNPNSPTVTTPNLSLSGSLKATADIVNGGGYTQYACWMGYLSWSTGFQPNLPLLAYQITTSTYDIWTAPYLNISNYVALAASTTAPYYQAISKIMLVYDYQALVDNYNNVPYSQAIKGTTVLNPVYDNGSAIYDDLMKQLDAAIVLIQKAPLGSTNPGVADIMYGGNMTNWLKFANTLKLRVALRQSNLSAKTAALKADVASTSALGYLDATNPALVNPGYLNSDANGGQESPLWRNYGETQNGGSQTNKAEYQANSYGVAKLSENGDPRDTAVYTTTNGAVISSAFGQTTPPTGGAPSTVGPGVLKSPTMSAIIMSSAEALFLQAEAVQAGYYTGGSDPATLYAAGITASFLDDGETAAQAATYIANAANAYPAADAAIGSIAATQQQAIIVQKWKALAIYGALEAFNEFRRTGYPNDIPLSIIPGANAPNQVTRIPYPAVEYKTNAANVAAQGTINVFTSKIFWAK